MSFSQEIYVTDAYGGAICFVRQHVLRLREKVEVFADDTERSLLATIEADRIIDWSARYTFKSPSGQVLGALGRRGMKSMWKAHYDVFATGELAPTFVIQEANPWAKMLDGLLGEIPFVGMFTGLILHPSYIATRGEAGASTLRLTKHPSIFESRFALTQEDPADEGEQLALMLSFLMVNLLERTRG